MKLGYLADHPQDAQTIAQWYFDEWAYTLPSIRFEQILEKVQTRVNTREAFPSIITLHEQGKLCACAELKSKENKHHPEYEHWIGGVFVEESSRGKGYAAALLKEAKQQVLKSNIEALYLQCEDKNLALYLKYGFKVLHSSEHNGIPTTIMVWRNAKD